MGVSFFPSPYEYEEVVISGSMKDCTKGIFEATWAYNTTCKTINVFNHYELYCGKKAWVWMQ